MNPKIVLASANISESRSAQSQRFLKCPKSLQGPTNRKTKIVKNECPQDSPCAQKWAKPRCNHLPQHPQTPQEQLIVCPHTSAIHPKSRRSRACKKTWTEWASITSSSIRTTSSKSARQWWKSKWSTRNTSRWQKIICPLLDNNDRGREVRRTVQEIVQESKRGNNSIWLLKCQLWRSQIFKSQVLICRALTTATTHRLNSCFRTP